MTAKWGAAGYRCASRFFPFPCILLAAHCESSALDRYIPNLSVQWDSSPRTVGSDTFELGGYPFTGTFRSTPAEWQEALQAGKEFLDATCNSSTPWCPITINAWNEWSEVSSSVGLPL